jgi:hypothetical protein
MDQAAAAPAPCAPATDAAPAAPPRHAAARAATTHPHKSAVPGRTPTARGATIACRAAAVRPGRNRAGRASAMTPRHKSVVLMAVGAAVKRTRSVLPAACAAQRGMPNAGRRGVMTRRRRSVAPRPAPTARRAMTVWMEGAVRPGRSRAGRTSAMIRKRMCAVRAGVVWRGVVRRARRAVRLLGAATFLRSRSAAMEGPV